MAAPTSLREMVLARIERTLRVTFADDGDVLDDLELKSDEELLAWYERIVGLELLGRRRQPERRHYRLDPPGFD